MEPINKIQSDNYVRAKKRVEQLKGFYIHALVYVAVNLFITLSKVIRNMYNGETFEQAFFETGTFFVWIAWGIGLGIHAMNVFGFNFLFGKNWEEKRIKEFMEKDTKNY